MKKKFLETIRQHNLLEKDMHMVIGLSGGPDSMCMFDLLCEMAEEWNLKLYPVHVNHKFRPGAAEEDQAFVEEICRQRGWPARTFVYDCNAIAQELGLTGEEAGRKVRYEAFRTAAEEVEKGGADHKKIVIAVAQNAEDQAETILFRILRGTGITGLSGIAYKRYDEAGYAVIRPLLDCSRKDIEDWCQGRGLNPRHDHTNKEPVYTRNRIRLQLLPQLEEYNPNITASLIRLGKSAAEDDSFLQELARQALEKALAADSTAERQVLSTEVLLNLHPAVRKRVYHIALQQIGLWDSLSAAHLAGIEQVLASDSPSARWNLPKPYIAEKRYDRLVLQRESSQEKGLLRKDELPPGSRKTLEGPGAEFSLSALQSVYGEDAGEKIVLRSRQAGDYMTIATGGSLHRKKLQDLLVDMKVPKSLRDQTLLAAIGSEVLWILPGNFRGRISAAYRVSDPSKESIIVLEYLR